MMMMIMLLLLLLVCSDVSLMALSDAAIEDIASMKETMKSLLQLNTSSGDLISISLFRNFILLDFILVVFLLQAQSLEKGEKPTLSCAPVIRLRHMVLYKCILID